MKRVSASEYPKGISTFLNFHQPSWGDQNHCSHSAAYEEKRHQEEGKETITDVLSCKGFLHWQGEWIKWPPFYQQLRSVKPHTSILVSPFWPQVGLCWAEGNIRADRSQPMSVIPNVCPQASSNSITRENGDTCKLSSLPHTQWIRNSGSVPTICISPPGILMYIKVQEPLA